jgi:hypothetical protein
MARTGAVARMNPDEIWMIRHVLAGVRRGGAGFAGRSVEAPGGVPEAGECLSANVAS